MHLQWSSIIFLACEVAAVADMYAAGRAMITQAGNLAARDEWVCPTGGAYTFCPGREACCSVGEPCITTAGHVNCRGSCYGSTCPGNFCCNIGFECPPPGGKYCIQRTIPFHTIDNLPPPSLPPVTFSDPFETTYTTESEQPSITPDPTTSKTLSDSGSSPTAKPEPSSSPTTTTTQSQSEGSSQTSSGPSNGASSETSVMAGGSGGAAASLSAKSAPWAIWVITWGIGLIFI